MSVYIKEMPHDTEQKKYSVTIFNINHMTQNKKQHILVKFSISTYVGNQSSMSNEKIIQELYSE